MGAMFLMCSEHFKRTLLLFCFPTVGLQTSHLFSSRVHLAFDCFPNPDVSRRSPVAPRGILNCCCRPHPLDPQ